MSGYFEAAEKRLEAAWEPGQGDLRKLGMPYWENIASQAGARVISMVTGPKCDAYLLSESSLFVFSSRLILITCGKTSLAPAGLALLESRGSDGLVRLSYERRREETPGEGGSPFEDEAATLARALPGPCEAEADATGRTAIHFTRAGARGSYSLEIVMKGIDKEIRSLFRAEAEADTSAIHGLLPGFEIDEHVFEPMGYSLNAVKGEDYFSVHVTPQDAASRVSFETSFRPPSGPHALVKRVTAMFLPSEFTVCEYEGRRPIVAPVTTVDYCSL